MSDITLHSTERELDAVRARLQSSRGRQFWRSLDELADTPAFHELLRREPVPLQLARADGSVHG